MKVVLQRVSEAHVKVNSKIVGKINNGLLLLIGIDELDDTTDADWLIKILCISQFTLLADYKKGNRPSYIKAAKPDKAIPLFEYFKTEIKKHSELKVESGIFGADMKVSLLNDGPVTIVLDSKTKM
jgi:D-tyrosyl-tRNA(Tyr) deacylase